MKTATLTSDQDIGRGTVAVDDRASDEVVDGRPEPVIRHECGQRLHGQAQILFTDRDAVLKAKASVIDRIHDGEADEQLHDTLKREALIPVDA